MKKVAILLTVFNRKDKTLQCLHSLYKQLPIDGYIFDVYLTNDGCTDGTPEAVAELFPSVNIINAKGDLFWNRGMYRAWAEAAKQNYDFYLWLNDDTFIYDNALATLLVDSRSKGDTSIICGATCSQVDGRITYGGRNGSKLVTPNGTLQSCQHFNGNIVLIPRSVYTILGSLDSTFTHAFGDFDYGLRAAKHNITAYQSSEFVGTCEQHDSLPKWCNPSIPLKDRCKAFNSPLGGAPSEQFYFERRHFGLMMAVFHYITIHIRLLFPVIWGIKKDTK